jgi:hypothetical protein
MANNVTLEPLMENMRKLLLVFNNEKLEITNDTIHNTILSDDDGSPPSKQQYRGAIKCILVRNGGVNVKFPTDWLAMSVQGLAEFIMSKQTA